MDAARSAGAQTYATAELRDAQTALAKYDVAVAQRDFRQALNHALEARDLAYTAARHVDIRKAELRNQADRLAAELDGLIARATTRLDAPGRPTGAAGTRVRTARDAGKVALQKARSQLAELHYHEAAAALEPAVLRLRREMPTPPAAAQKRKK